MHSASLLLQRVDSYLEGNPLMQTGARFLGCRFIAGPLSKKLPIVELFSKPLLPLEANNPERFRKISWIVPAGGMALSTAVAYTAYNATTSLSLKILIELVHLAAIWQFTGARSALDPNTISLNKLFQHWSGINRVNFSKEHYSIANMLAHVITIFSYLCFLRLLHWHPIPAHTTVATIALAVRTLCLKSLHWEYMPQNHYQLPPIPPQHRIRLDENNKPIAN